MVRHSVAGNAYGDVRIGAFMGKKLINDLRARNGHAPIAHLAELSVKELQFEYLHELPEAMLGSDFLARYKTHEDPVTTIQPDATYRVAGPTRHPIEENERVMRFMKALHSANAGNTEACIEAGQAMYDAHQSYSENCRLSVPQVDFLVEAVRKRGPAFGLYGAKITGGGTGGTVAVFGTKAGLKEHIPHIAVEYSRRVGGMPDIFEGTSPGALEFGARRYLFGATGWRPVPT
jgi:L-arabinokinase